MRIEKKILRRIKNGSDLSRYPVSTILLYIYVLFLIYLTFKPFLINFDVVSRQFKYFCLTISKISSTITGTKADIIANIIVFIPLGFLQYWHAWHKIKNDGKVSFFTSFAFFGGLTVFIEFGQLFLPERHPSVVDILANISGGIAGFAIAEYLFIKSSRKTLIWLNVLTEKWDIKLYIFLLISIFAYGWYPFLVNITKWTVKYHISYLKYSQLSVDGFFNAIPYLILFFYLQLLAMEILQRYSNLTKLRFKISVSLFWSLLTVVILVSGQLFMRRRAMGWDDITAALTGVVVAAFFSAYLYHKRSLLFNKNNKYLAGLLSATFYLNILFILSATLLPFNMNLSLEVAQNKAVMFFIPFNSYQNDNIIVFLMDLTKDIVKFITVTIILSALYELKGKIFNYVVFWKLFLAVLLLEFLQLFHAKYYPDISDVLLGFLSIYLGRRLWLFGNRFLRAK